MAIGLAFSPRRRVADLERVCRFHVARFRRCQDGHFPWRADCSVLGAPWGKPMLQCSILSLQPSILTHKPPGHYFLACTYMRQYGALVCENMHAAISQIAFAVKWTFATIKHSGPAGAPDVPDVITRNRRLGMMPEGIKHGQVPGRAPITLLPSPSLQHEGAKNFP